MQEILKCLRKDSRKSLTKISQETKIPLSTVFDKMKVLKKFVRCVSMINFEKIGYSLKVEVIVKADNLKKLEGFLVKCYNINNLFIIQGEYDYLFEGIFKDFKEFEEFREELKGYITEKNEYLVLEDLKI